MKRIFPFIEWRYRAYIFTAVLVVLFAAGTAFHGGINYGIDFVGGTSVIVKLDKPVDGASLAQLRTILEPLGLSQNIRTIGGVAASKSEAREISIDVRGSDWVDRMVERFDAERKSRELKPDDLDAVFGAALEPRVMAEMKAYFLPPAGDTTAPPMYAIATATTSDLNEIFQSIFNENISLSVQRALSDALVPEGGLRTFDINNVGGAGNLAATLAELKRAQVEKQIAARIGDTGAARPWKTVEEFLKVTGLEIFDRPELRRVLTAETAPVSPNAVSVATAGPEALSRAFLGALSERFLRNAEIVVAHRDGDIGGLFASARQAADLVPVDDVEMRSLIVEHAHAGRFIIASSETVGAAVGSDLKVAALYAIFFSLLGLLGYIWFRFELRYAVGGVIATVHDTLLTLGLIGFMGIEFNIPIVAAVLTVMGYSINDTVVVYDRIREKLGKLKSAPDPAIIDLAITETLSRTMLTGGSTILSILAFMVLGPAVTFDLCFALGFGIIIGTFSSIFVAAPVLVEWERFGQGRRK